MLPKSEFNPHKIIDLKGPEGNVFYLMGLAKQWGKQLGLDTPKIIEDMKSSDYKHAVEVFKYYFSSVCTIKE